MTKQKKRAKIKILFLSITVGAMIGGSAKAQEIEVKSWQQEEQLEAINLSEVVKDELEKNMIIFTPKTQSNASAIFKMQSLDSEFSKLNSKNLFKDYEFQKRYGKKDIIYSRKVIFEMQSFAKYISKKYNVPSQTTEEIVYSTYIESHKEEISPLLILSLIGIESTYNPKAKSYVGATGLTQVMPNIHRTKVKELGVDLNSIQGNIKVGIAILREYIDKDKGNIKKALQRYNGSYYDKSLKYSGLVFEKMEVFQAIQEKNKKIFEVFES